MERGPTYGNPALVWRRDAMHIRLSPSSVHSSERLKFYSIRLKNEHAAHHFLSSQYCNCHVRVLRRARNLMMCFQSSGCNTGTAAAPAEFMACSRLHTSRDVLMAAWVCGLR